MTADQHGTNSTYVNHRCRCDRCKAAHAVAQRELNKKYRARYLALGLTANGKRPKRPNEFDRWREGAAS